jgi:hypothetical protein
VKYTDDCVIGNVNHTTTIGIVAILALAVFTPGVFAVSTAYAGGHGHGDSFSVKSKFNQKNICWAVDDSRTTCRNDASVFGRNVRQQSTTPPPSTMPPPREPECIPATVGGITAVLSGTSCSATLPAGTTGAALGAFNSACELITGGQLSGGGQAARVCTFPATQA